MKIPHHSNQASELQPAVSIAHKKKIKTPLRLLALAVPLLFASGPAGLASPYTPLNGAQPRPFYVFAHNPNTLEGVTNALKNGCNALEPDIATVTCGPAYLINFDSDIGEPDCNEIQLLQWCDAVNGLAQQYPKLALVVFDIKSDAAKHEYGPGILSAARDHLNANGVQLNVIYSIAEHQNGEVFDLMLDPMVTQLGPREGVQIDAENNADDVFEY